MSAQIIDLRPAGAVTVKCNGARDALLDIALNFKNTSDDDASKWCDFILAEMWMRGFKVVEL